MKQDTAPRAPDDASRQGWIARTWRRWVLEPIHQLEVESRASQAGRTSAWDWRTAIVCIVVAIDLTLLQYFGLSDRVGWIPDALRMLGFEEAANAFLRDVLHGARARFWGLMYWVGSCVLVYFAIPVLVVKLVFRQRLSDYGLGLRGAFKHIGVYAALFAIVLPTVFIASADPSFQRQYPFYRDYAQRIPPNFALWEVAYAIQFFALEFFFRGFMLHGLKHRFGFYAVFAMMVPYCMIHFGKPFPETIGAILAGLVLGFLSLRTGTIWLGFLIHVSVALAMDLAALWRQGLLF